MTEMLLLFSTGLGVGLLAGLLGVGGGIVMVPVLMFVLPALGAPAVSLHQATGISASQSFISGISSSLTHSKQGNVHRSLIMPLVPGTLIGGLAGGYASHWVDALWLYWIFAVCLIATLASSLLIKAPRDSDTAETDLSAIRFPMWWKTTVVGGISFLSANIGIGGSVMLLPLLIVFKRVPVRLAIGTGAVMVLVTAFSSMTGKALQGMIPFDTALWVSLGALIGGALGARLSRHCPTHMLQGLLNLLMALALLRTLWEISQQLL